MSKLAMASRSDARHKSRLIREMARDLNRHDHSVASSTGSHHGTVSDSTISDFDPENEAIMSTRQVDADSQRLPQLRDTAKKYGRWNGGRQPDFVINTSAIGRAFPDFSQGGSSDDSIEIEVGRGAKTRQRTPSQVLRPEYSENIDSPIVTIGDFRILDTPPIKQPSKASQQHDAQRSSSRKATQNLRSLSNSHKENIPPSNSTSPAFVPGYVSGASRTGAGEQRRTLVELHARVADESDGSFLADERPATLTFPQKKSRFSNFQARSSPLSNVSNQKNNQVTDAMVDSLAGRRKASQLQTPSKPSISIMNSNTPNPTNQSFLLPNMPEISELVSGTFKDGTPVFTKNGQIQSRFTSMNGVSSAKADHNPVDSIPVPSDEKAIFLSLQLLQDKVAELEMERANTQRVVQELQNDNYQLQAEKKELQMRRRSDSALGMGDSASDGEYARDNQKLVAEKTKLEGQVKSLQNRLEFAERKTSNQDLRLKTNTAERDQAVKQLVEAFNLTEHLKSENVTLREVNQSLRQQLSQLLSESEENAHKWHEMETALHNKVNRRNRAISQMRDTTRDLDDSSHAIRITKLTSRSTKNSRTTNHQQSEKRQNKSSNGQSSSRGRPSNSQPSTSVQGHSQQRLRSRSRSQTRRVSKQAEIQDDYNQEVSVSDASDEDSFEETTKTIHKDINVTAHNNVEGEDDTNFSSILGDDLVRMRERIAHNRQISAARTSSLLEQAADSNASQAEDETLQSIRSVRSNNTLHRKSSGQALAGILKNRIVHDQIEATGRLSVRSNDGGVEKDRTTRSDASHHRRNSENSARISTRRITQQDMTSAFILPDITISGFSHGIQHPVLSESARRKLDQLCQHDTRNCTICSRVTSFESRGDNSTTAEIKKTVQIEKPVPVSERMPAATSYEDEHTMRPAVAPGLALATVIKGLQDEVSHLKVELSPLQVLYNQHDPSLGMRKRKAISSRINKLLKEIERKSDQLYALFDVLEGQKQTGQEMSEKEVEVTLQNIGVDVEALKGTRPETQDNHSGDGDDDEGSELDLPWEGIDDTISSRRQSWRL